MVHPVQIVSFHTPNGGGARVAFTLDGTLFNACFEGNVAEAADLLAAGATYPLALTIAARGKVDYAEPGAGGLQVARANAAGDMIRFLARTWQTIDMATVLLACEPQVALRLQEPQFATDFRGGSWLTGEGVLCASLPEDHHD